MFDLSPIVAMFVLIFIRGAIISGALFLMSQLKIIG
jgi:uncharacterized protein YggT (Ycf19 family)